MSQGHRVSTPRGEKGGGRRFFSQIEPNWPLPYSTVPLPLLRDAKPAGWVTYCSICVSTMLTAQNRAAKCSILLQRRFALPILLYLFFFIYGQGPGACSGYFMGKGDAGILYPAWYAIPVFFSGTDPYHGWIRFLFSVINFSRFFL